MASGTKSQPPSDGILFAGRVTLRREREREGETEKDERRETETEWKTKGGALLRCAEEVPVTACEDSFCFFLFCRRCYHFILGEENLIIASFKNIYEENLVVPPVYLQPSVNYVQRLVLNVLSCVLASKR